MQIIIRSVCPTAPFLGRWRWLSNALSFRYTPVVILDSKSRRRWFGALCLLAATGMLVAGETVLKDRLSMIAFVLYWFGCFGFTLLAILTALADARALKQEGREQQRALLERTLGDIKRRKQPRE